jgi:hypothetical protein
LRASDVALGSDEVQDETNPEGDAEEFMRRETGEMAGSEENSDDGANGGDGEAN